MRAGQIGAARRWGPRRIVKLADLDPATAHVIRAILRAEDNARKEAGTAVEPVPAMSTEGTADATSTL